MNGAEVIARALKDQVNLTTSKFSNIDCETLQGIEYVFGIVGFPVIELGFAVQSQVSKYLHQNRMSQMCHMNRYNH